MPTSPLIIFAVLLLSVLQVHSQVTCPQPPTPAPGRLELEITVDNTLFLYVDGSLVADLPWYDNATAADRVPLPPYTRLLAINGQAFDIQGGILASVNTNSGSYALTDSSWKCVTNLVSGWQELGFDDSAWPAAFEIGQHGNNPAFNYGCIAGISPDAYWIWTSRYTGSGFNRNIWCRGYLPLCSRNNPCENGGTCLSNAVRICTCPAEFSGELCEIDLNPCRSSPCQNGGTCSNNVGGGGFTCQCAPEYTGSQCETMLNACESSPCLNGGTCFNGGSFFRCTCSPYYTGTRCETGIPASCGSIMHKAESPNLPSGWSLGCYIGVGDEIYWNTPCFGLLQGLSYFGSYDQLLAAGGNFGCWTTRDPQSTDVYNACRDNYQQDIYVRQCSSCNFLAVCIRFP